MRIKKIASFNVKEGVKSVRYSDLNSGIQYLPADGIINIKSEKVRIAGFGVNESSLYKIDVNGTPYSIGSVNSIYLSNAGIITSRSIGGSKGTLSWAMAISDKFGVTVDGTLYAMGGHFAGTIEAKSGKIGTTLINEDGSIVSANGGFRLDANGDLTISHVGGSQLVQDTQTALSTANDAKGKISTVANDLSNLSIGGRNLLLATKDFGVRSMNYGYPYVTYATIEDNGVRGNKAVVTTGTNDGTKRFDALGYNKIFNSSNPFKPDTDYTLSFYVKADKETTFSSFFYPSALLNDGHTVTTATTEWKRVVITWHTRSDSNHVNDDENVIVARIETDSTKNVKLYISSPKFEEGNKATDWSPAPEDVESGISNANDKASQAHSLADTANNMANNALNQANSAIDQANAGMNKWLVTKYNSGKSDNSITTIPLLLINKLVPESTMEHSNAFSDLFHYVPGPRSGIIFSGEKRVAYAVTYVNFNADTTVSNLALFTDDGGTLYLNGSQIIRNDSCTISSEVSVTFKKGWNVIEAVIHNGPLAGGFALTTYDSSAKTYSALDLTKLPNFQRMDCYCSAFSGQTAYGLAVNAKVLETSSSLETVSRTVTDNKNGVKDLMTRTSQVETNVTNLKDLENTHYSTVTTQYNNQQKTIDGTVTRLGNAENRITTVSNDLSNLSVGGRNLFEKSGKLTSDESCLRGAGSNLSITDRTTGTDAKTESGQYIACKISNPGGGGVFLEGLFGNYTQKLKGGEVYTVSVYAKADKNYTVGSIIVEWMDRVDNVICPNYSTEWQRYIVTGRARADPTGGYIAIAFYPPANTFNDTVFYISSPKVEIGNRPTAWSPAPEDFDNKITEQSNALATYKQTTDQNLAQISSTYQRKDGMSNYATNSSVTSAINQAKDQINSSVSSNYVKTSDYNASKKALEDRMSSAEQNITDSAIVSTVKSSHDWSELQKNASKLDWQVRTDLDLNSMTTDGRYFLKVVSGLTNAYPGCSGWQYLIVESVPNQSRVTQTMWHDDSVDNTGYTRKLNSGGSWTPWVREANTANAISVINQTSESIKIQANRIDIDGLVTFNGSNNAIANKIKSDINNVQVGGTNLCLNSAHLEKINISGNGVSIKTQAINDGGNYDRPTNALKITLGKGQPGFYFDSNYLDKLVDGHEYVVSMYICCQNRDFDNFNFVNCEWMRNKVWINNPKNDRNNEQRIAFRGTYYKDAPYRAMTFYPGNISEGETYCISAIQVEEGNKLTSWSPAPEDVDASVADAKKAGTDAQTTANTAVANAKTAQTAANNANTNAENQKYYRIIECASHSNDYPGTGIWLKINNVQQTLNNLSRGLNVASINPITLAVEGTWGFDTFAGGDNVTNFNSKIAELNGGNHIIVVMSYDASYPSRVADALRSIGGTVYTPGSSYRESYVLIGKSNLGYGNGVERYNPAPASNKWQAIASCRVSENGALMSSNSGSLASYTKVELDEIDKKATATDLLVSNWCNLNDKTLIDGSKIYTGTITADKLNINEMRGTNGVIYLKDGTFDYGNGKLKWDGSTLTVNAISVINQSSESIKIQANRIDIDGLVTFNGSNNAIANKIADAKKAGTDAQTAASDAQSRATTLEQWRTNTVDSRLNHAYNVVNHWAQDATSDSTTINGGLIQTNTITTDKIRANAITADKIRANAITADKIRANAITADKITTKDIVGTNGRINLRTGTFDYGNGKFKWDGSSLTINGNGTFSGNISANTGKIADYTINGAKLVGNNVGLSGTAGQGWAFWAGSNDADSAPFRVGHEGYLVASNAEITGTISGSTINGGTINGAKITGTVTNGGTITGGNIWGDFVQAQFLQTASNSATNGHGCDLWTAVIKCSSIIDQTATSRIDLSDEKVHIYTHYNSNILLSPSYARIQASNGPYVCCDGNGVSLYGNANNLRVCADNKIWVKEYDGGTMNTGTVVFSRNGNHTVSFYWGNDTDGGKWHLQTYVDNTYVGNAV